MNYTDQQLRLTLAKMLSEEIIPQVHYGYPACTRFYWNDKTMYGTDVLDTEWLHVCWLVEQTLTPDEYDAFWNILAATLPEPTGKEQESRRQFRDRNFLSASWQRRAIALAKVKGVKIV